MTGSSLWKISVSILPEAEEAITQLLEVVLGEPASVYADARTRISVASVYLHRASDWSAAKHAALRTALRQSKAKGVKLGPGKISARKIRRQDWAESWRRHFRPIEIGSALLLKPSWSKRKPRKNQKSVVLDPGLSFGTGHHPTTQFCLEQIVTFQKTTRPKSFLDIGTGSGILAIAAAQLGYQPVMGFDIDAQAIQVARANAKQNGVLGKVRLACQDLSRLPQKATQKHDLICANLIVDLLLAEKARLRRLLAPGGTLVLAGILKSEWAEVRAAYESCGLKLARHKAGEEWTSGAFVSEDGFEHGNVHLRSASLK